MWFLEETGASLAPIYENPGFGFERQPESNTRPSMIFGAPSACTLHKPRVFTSPASCFGIATSGSLSASMRRLVLRTFRLLLMKLTRLEFYRLEVVHRESEAEEKAQTRFLY